MMMHVDLEDFAPHCSDERTHWRRFADLELVLRDSNGNTYVSTLQDISEHGCKVSLVHSNGIERDRWVGLQLVKAHYVIGRVCWSTDSIIGLKFLAPVSPAVVEHVTFTSLLRRLAQARLSRDEISNLPRPADDFLKFAKRLPAD